MKRKEFFLLSIFIICLISAAQAKVIIWQIGDMDGSQKGFNSFEKRVIEYQVPANWDTLLDQDNPNWGEFPPVLYPGGDKENDPNDLNAPNVPNDPNNPQEIRINFNYLQDYCNPTLIIRAMKISDANSPGATNILVYKGENERFIGENEVIENHPFYPYNFPLSSYIKKGFHEKNEIIIRNNGPPGVPIIFDTLYLSFDDRDSDGDGVYDVEEREPYQEDQSVACIPIKSYDPECLFKKMIILEIEESQEAAPYFREAGFFDPNLLNIPQCLPADRLVLHGYLRFNIEGIGPLAQVKVRFRYINYINPEDILDPSLCFYSYRHTDGWQKTPFEFLDGNTVVITLTDNGKGNLNDQKEGLIETILAQTYAKSLGMHIESRGCFIEALSWRKNNER